MYGIPQLVVPHFLNNIEQCISWKAGEPVNFKKCLSTHLLCIIFIIISKLKLILIA